jgi:hypothetical protein
MQVLSFTLSHYVFTAVHTEDEVALNPYLVE